MRDNFKCRIYGDLVRLGRENGAWVFFSILFTPVLGIILLHCLGKTDEQEKNDFLERKMWENNV